MIKLYKKIMYQYYIKKIKKIEFCMTCCALADNMYCYDELERKVDKLYEKVKKYNV